MFKSLDYIVKNVLLDNYEEHDGRYFRYLQMAVNGLRELSFILPNFIKTVSIPFDPIKGFVDLPKDFVRYTKVGIVVDGQLVALGPNTDLLKNRKYDDCGNEIRQLDPCQVSENEIVYFYNYNHNGSNGAIYGYGPGHHNWGEYDFDYENQRIVFSSDLVTSEIYLEYASNGIPSDGEILVPEEAIDALTMYVHWRRLWFDKSAQVYDKQRTERRYIAAKKALRRRVNGYTIEMFIVDAYKGYMQAPK